MGKQFSVALNFPTVALLPPAADAAGRTSAYASLKNADKCYLFALINQGNAAPVTLTPVQAKDVSGTGSKAINSVPIWMVADTSISDALVSQTSAPNFTTSATLKNKLVVFELEPLAAMDINNGFQTVAISTSASNAANITAAWLSYVPAFQQSALPSVLTN